MEKIEIRNFVGIKDITIEVKQINILIGPQASGKSIIAKLLFYFKSFILEIIDSAVELKSKKDLEKEFKLKFLEYFPSSSWGNKSFKIRYYLDEKYIEISYKRSQEKKNTEVELSYSELYKREFSNFLNLTKSFNQGEEKLKNKFGLRFPNIKSYELKNTFLFIIAEVVSNYAAFSQLYIPAGRSFYANLKKALFYFLSANNAVDSFLIDFGIYYEQIKEQAEFINMRGKSNNEKLYDEIKNLKDKILNGKYMQKNGEDYLEVAEDRQVKLIKSSSGQQETLPLTIILETIAYDQPEVGGNSIYIEEPESHVFPSTQKNIVELISTVYNARKDSLQFFITTHSPYILTAFNNLIQAGILAEDATKEKIEQISRHVPKTRFLSPEEVAVYSLEDGYCKSIIDEETGLIDANIIDEVSNELAIQFDELLNLEE